WRRPACGRSSAAGTSRSARSPARTPPSTCRRWSRCSGASSPARPTPAWRARTFAAAPRRTRSRLLCLRAVRPSSSRCGEHHRRLRPRGTARRAGLLGCAPVRGGSGPRGHGPTLAMDVREDDLLALVPEGVYVDGKVQTGQAVTIRDGRIVQVGAIPDGADVLRLPNRLLVPGLVNAHSHAFQRAIRGRTESREPGRESDDFWSWRERMYHAALRLDPDDLEAVSRMAFLEMVLSGITAVGEFHYLHHPAEGGRYADPDELALRVFHAAKTVGIRIVLLRVGYARAGHDRPAHPRQMRFVDERVEDVIEAADRLAARGIAVGLAPHSVRALPLPWIRAMAEHARRNGWPLHMHVSEQPREIEQCLAEHGLRPVALLDREGLVDERFTGVHAIHLAPEEIEALGRARANVCACPTTERNLGDGIVPARELFALGATISFGTDSQVEIAPL